MGIKPQDRIEEMAMPYSPILATLAYVLSPDGKKCLMVHRNSRPDDEQLGKYNGLGGKIERNEDIIASIRRELREEAAIECEKIVLRGTISWPGFGRNGEDWFGFVFLVSGFIGTVPSQNVGVGGMNRDIRRWYSDSLAVAGRADL